MESDAIRQAVEQAIEAVFAHRDQQSNLDRDTHAEHHAWLAERIASEKDKAEFWHSIRNKTVPWAIVALLGWTATVVWTWITVFVSGHWK